MLKKSALLSGYSRFFLYLLLVGVLLLDPEGLLPGDWQDVVMLWTAAGAAGVPANAVIDRGAVVEECDEADNRVDFVLTETLLPDLAIVAGGITAPTYLFCLDGGDDCFEVPGSPP